MEPVRVTRRRPLTTHLSQQSHLRRGTIVEFIDYLYAIAGAIYTQISTAFGS
ncbi:hypothetical protein QE397_002477 [Rhodococcus sp. SORGH_AS 301]|nr:hypothetical protein [Rhodococcus sp. SORGH_AS_0301]